MHILIIKRDTAYSAHEININNTTWSFVCQYISLWYFVWRCWFRAIHTILVDAWWWLRVRNGNQNIFSKFSTDIRYSLMEILMEQNYRVTLYRSITSIYYHFRWRCCRSIRYHLSSFKLEIIGDKCIIKVALESHPVP